MTTPTGAFDAHHPPSVEQVENCVHCGFCLPACPTYALWGKEADSPRGRIYLMNLGLEGRISIDDSFTRHFDTCLGCMACVTACPSGVQYDQLIEATRSQVERHTSRTIGDRLFRYLLFSLFPYPGRLRFAALNLWVYQKLGLQALLRSTGILNWIPARLRALESVAPPVALKSLFRELPARIPAAGKPRRTVALVLGCVQRTFFSDVNDATARVLSAEGCDVIVPQTQGCCGALMVHAGLEGEAVSMAKRFVDAFDRVDVDAIVTNAAGCGSTIKEYGHLLRDEPAYAARATALANKCRDISEVLADLTPQAPRHPLRMAIAYHDACHLQHAQQVTEQPRRVLATIPDLEVREIPEAGLCCGSAGVYNLVEPNAADALGRRKLKNILTTGVDAVISSNPGCLLQLQAKSERPIPMFHLVELVDASIRNRPLAH